MGRNALTIREMGAEACSLLIHQAMGIKNAKMRTDFMTDRVAVLLFARASLPERLCVTAAVRQMNGSTLYQGIDGSNWREEAISFQAHLFSILGYYMDCLYSYGLNTDHLATYGLSQDFPLINAGSADAHPVNALADLACMLSVKKQLEGVKAAWIGCVNGTLHSIIECAAFFPFSISIATPPEEDIRALKKRSQELGAAVSFTQDPDEAVAGADFIFAGRRSEQGGANTPYAITAALMARADANARLLVSATPLRAIMVAPEVMSGKRSMLIRQAKYRLCVHKRLLHWVFEKAE